MDDMEIVLLYQFHRFFFAEFSDSPVSVLRFAISEALFIDDMPLIREDLHPFVVFDDRHGNMDLFVTYQKRLPNLKTGQPSVASYGVQSTLCENDVPVVNFLLFPLESLYIEVVVTVTAIVYVLPPPVYRSGPSPLWLVEMFGLWA